MLRIRDVYPDVYPDPDFIHPGSNDSNKRGGGKSLLLYLYCGQKYHKIVSYFIFKQVKKDLGQFTKKYRTVLLTKKIFHYAKINKVLFDLGSGIQDKIYSESSGSRGPRDQKDTRSRIRVRNTAYGRHLPDILMLLQRLVERKDDLAVGEAVQGLTLLLHPLHRPFLQTEEKEHHH